MPKIRERLLIFLAHKVGLPYFKLVRKRPSFPFSLADLQKMPEDTVGAHLAAFLNTNNLHLLSFYEKHDIKHVVLDYGATEEGEVCLQCFMLANGRLTLPVLVAVLFGWLSMPEYFHSFKKAWNHGKRTPSLQSVAWFTLLDQNLESVRKQLSIHQFNSSI